MSPIFTGWKVVFDRNIRNLELQVNRRPHSSARRPMPLLAITLESRYFFPAVPKPPTALLPSA